MFLVGAYQEILGDMHNLLGDTAVHVTLGENGDDNTDGAERHHQGDTVQEAEYVEFDPEVLMAKLRRDVEAAVNRNAIEDQQAGRLLRFYEEAMMGYTYLEDPSAE